jgi:hypothetical protein
MINMEDDKGEEVSSERVIFFAVLIYLDLGS